MMFDGWESMASFVCKPLIRGVARSRAAKWIASNLQASCTPCQLDAGGLKACFEKAYPGQYVPMSAFEKLLSDAGLLIGDQVYASFQEVV